MKKIFKLLWYLILWITYIIYSIYSKAKISIYVIIKGFLPKDIEKNVVADLQNSGKYNYINHKHIRQITVSKVTLKFYGTLDIKGILLLEELVGNQGYISSYQLVDLVNHLDRFLTKNQFKVIRYLLHYVMYTINNKNFGKLIGFQSVFLVNIAYIVSNNIKKFPYESIRSVDYDWYNQCIVYSSSRGILLPGWFSNFTKSIHVVFDNIYSTLAMETLLTDKDKIHKIIFFAIQWCNHIYSLWNQDCLCFVKEY